MVQSQTQALGLLLVGSEVLETYSNLHILIPSCKQVISSCYILIHINKSVCLFAWNDIKRFYKCVFLSLNIRLGFFFSNGFIVNILVQMFLL